MRRSADVLAAGLVVGMAVPISGVGAAQSGLVLSPPQGRVGATIEGDQRSLTECATYRLRWDNAAGRVLGSDSGSDGRGTVSFTVPDSALGSHMVIATCQASPAGPEIDAGRTEFFVVVPAPVPVPTSRPATSTSPVEGPRTTVATAPTATTRPPSTTAPAGSSTTSPPSPQPTKALPRDIADCERQARAAKSQLLYQPNRRMTIGASYDVVVKLALESSDVSAAVLPGPDQTTIVQVRSARCTIEAQLTGADFEVTPPDARPQSFLDARVLTWRWQVSPTRTGADLKLVLRLQPTVVEDGRPPRPGSDDFYEALIEVDSEPPSLISKVGDGVNGFVGNPLAQLLLIPSGGGLITLWARHKIRKRATEPAGEG